MRILVADQNALLLAAITATFGPHCDLVTATRRDVCLAQLEQHRFDVVIAGDKLSDYTGLELLSEVPVISPDTLLIFAADPKRLQQLGKRLALFGLFEALSYPLTPQKLVDALRRVREKLQASQPPKVRHVVLEDEWDTGERFGLIEQELQDGDDFVFAGPPTVPAAASVSAERLVEGSSVVAAAGVPDSAASPNRAAAGRTFEGTPVAPDSEAMVTEYEVRPATPALTHQHTATPEDEFVFALAVETVAAGVPVAQEVAQEQEDVRETAEDVTARGVTARDVTVQDVTARDVTAREMAEEASPEPESELDFLSSNDPVFDPPEPPKWAEDGAANDTAFEAKRADLRRNPAADNIPSRVRAAAELPAPPAQAASASRDRADAKVDLKADPKASPKVDPKKGTETHRSPASATKSSAPSATAPKGPAQPRVRAQTVPTDAQRAAFERALARRNGGQEPDSAPVDTGRRSAKPTIQLGSTAGVFSGLPLSGKPSKSLSDLAKMAGSKRPLTDAKLGKSVPNRAVFAVGSGVAAVLILGVLSFELLRNSGEAEHHMPHAHAQNTQVFSSSTTMMASSDGRPAQLVAPPPQTDPPSQQPVPSNQPQAQSFDPDTAPPDPPPPPTLEHPGPSEPPSAPSMGNTDPPPWAMLPESQESPIQ